MRKDHGSKVNRFPIHRMIAMFSHIHKLMHKGSGSLQPINLHSQSPVFAESLSESSRCFLVSITNIVMCLQFVSFNHSCQCSISVTISKL